LGIVILTMQLDTWTFGMEVIAKMNVIGIDVNLLKSDIKIKFMKGLFIFFTLLNSTCYSQINSPSDTLNKQRLMLKNYAFCSCIYYPGAYCCSYRERSKA
jgi:hypothetical protein